MRNKLSIEDTALVVNFIELIILLYEFPKAYGSVRYNINKIAKVCSARIGKELSVAEMAELAEEYYASQSDPYVGVKKSLWKYIETMGSPKFDEDLWNSAFEE